MIGNSNRFSFCSRWKVRSWPTDGEMLVANDGKTGFDFLSSHLATVQNAYVKKTTVIATE